MITYQLISGSTNIKRVDSLAIPPAPAIIPADPANGDYAAFLAWVALGNTPLAADPPPSPIPSVQDQLDALAARAYVNLTAIRGMTPGQVQSFADSNVQSLPEIRDAMKTILVALCVLARRL